MLAPTLTVTSLIFTKDTGAVLGEGHVEDGVEEKDQPWSKPGTMLGAVHGWAGGGGSRHWGLGRRCPLFMALWGAAAGWENLLLVPVELFRGMPHGMAMALA